jgi:hypothetical protein
MTAPASKRRKNAHVWERSVEDFYVEPEWCSRRLFEQVGFSGTVYDPACGLGRIVRAAREEGYESFGTDIAKRSQDCGSEVDFLSCQRGQTPVNSIVCNPPFKLAEAFVNKALQIAEYEVAMLLPSTWRCGDSRSRWLEATPLAAVLDLTPRPSMPPGTVIEAEIDAGGGTTDYAWYIWRRGYKGAYRGGWLRRDR